jgi:hypothetical protein
VDSPVTVRLRARAARAAKRLSDGRSKHVTDMHRQASLKRRCQMAALGKLPAPLAGEFTLAKTPRCASSPTVPGARRRRDAPARHDFMAGTKDGQAALQILQHQITQRHLCASPVGAPQSSTAFGIILYYKPLISNGPGAGVNRVPPGISSVWGGGAGGAAGAHRAGRRCAPRAGAG